MLTNKSQTPHQHTYKGYFVTFRVTIVLIWLATRVTDSFSMVKSERCHKRGLASIYFPK